jgi:hypothetical protein
MGCGCGSGGTAGRKGKYKVVYPDGKFSLKKTLADAELAKAKVPGARIVTER